MEYNLKNVFGKLNKGEIFTMIVFSVLCFFFAINGQGELLVALTLLFSCLGFFNHLGMALGAIIIAGSFVTQLSTGFFYVLSYVPFLLASFYKMVNKGLGAKPFVTFVFGLVLFFLSYLLGVEPDISVLLLQIISMAVFYTISSSFNQNDVAIAVFSYLCSGLLLFLFINTGGLLSNIDSGRLAFGENVKGIAYSCSIPLVFLVFSFLDRSYLFDNFAGKKYIRIVDIVLIVIFLLIIFMTLARGLMLALVIGVVLLSLLTKKSGKSIFIVVIGAVLAMLVFNYVESLDVFRTERLFATEEYSTGNGRTEIWEHHFREISNLGSRYVVLGIGPGNVARVSMIEGYAHSMILDYYFSYGILGFLFFVIVEIVTLKRMFKRSNIIPFVVVVTYLIAYSTHGGAANPPFFILQGLMLANIKVFDKCATINHQ